MFNKFFTFRIDMEVFQLNMVFGRFITNIQMNDSKVAILKTAQINL